MGPALLKFQMCYHLQRTLQFLNSDITFLWMCLVWVGEIYLKNTHTHTKSPCPQGKESQSLISLDDGLWRVLCHNVQVPLTAPQKTGLLLHNLSHSTSKSMSAVKHARCKDHSMQLLDKKSISHQHDRSSLFWVEVTRGKVCVLLGQRSLNSNCYYYYYFFAM